MSARFIVGDVRDVLATLPDASVDLVFTSPPFLALRSYLPADHPDKAREIGSEPDPGAFIDTLLGVTEDLARVLAPHGSLCVELGDTYSGSGGAGGDPAFKGSASRSGWHRLGNRAEQADQPPNYRKDGTSTDTGSPNGGRGWPEAKSACLIPELYRLSLAYGRNPLTGRETPRWRVRNTIRWCRPNPPVGALGDKFRPATSEIVVACKAKDRYFDLDAVRTPFQHPDANDRNGDRGGPTFGLKGPNNDRGDFGAGNFHSIHAGAPPLDWWKIPTHGYPGAHYATFPPALVTIPLLAMCPERVCTVCGQPSRRIVEPTAEYRATVAGRPFYSAADRGGKMSPGRTVTRQNDTLGWSDCGHDSWRRGVVLDPFGGSGTVAEVATGHGRDAILIDIDHRNADLARQRVGMFLEIDEPPTVVDTAAI